MGTASVSSRRLYMEAVNRPLARPRENNIRTLMSPKHQGGRGLRCNIRNPPRRPKLIVDGPYPSHTFN